MKAKELMIGDWVQGFFPDTYSQIGQTTWNGSVIIFTRNGVEIDLNEEDVQPVPLTAEILEKNGFLSTYKAEDNGEYKIPYNPFSVRYADNEDGFSWYGEVFGYDIDYSYVHELQHALRLCGMSELADNFKV